MRHLITSALPYANGALHFGHLAGVYLPADIYTRHLRLKGEKCLHICGSDEHGVGIMQNADKQKKQYKPYVDRWHKEHKDLFDLYGIDFDFFGQTSEPYHAEEVLEWFKLLLEKGFIEKQTEEQLQCQSCSNYLPDRYVEGKCYVCDYPEARGDECPSCGTWIDPIKLIEPVCKFCGSQDIKTTEVDQWYLMLSKYHKEYRKWLEGQKGKWKKTVYSFLDSLTQEKMVDRAITRDLKWGIDVPLDEAKGKKLYVWFDAPIGYVSNTKKLLEGSEEHYLKDWWQNPETNLTHFVGKDNVIFHGLIFPVMSMASGRVKPCDQLPANQYLNLGDQQFSKSKGVTVDAKGAIHQYGEDNLRYYLTTLIPENQDSNFTWEGFESRVNGELVNNIGNFFNRGLSFFWKNWKDGIGSSEISSFFESQEFKALLEKRDLSKRSLDRYEFKKALEIVMSAGQDCNAFFQEKEPWALIKTDENACRAVIAEAAVRSLLIGGMLIPLLPQLSQKVFGLFELDSPEKIYTLDASEFKPFIGDLIKLAKKPKALVRKVELTE